MSSTPNTSRQNSNKAASDASWNGRRNARRAPPRPHGGIGARRRHQIQIEKLAFTPPQVSAHVGDTLQWVNADFVAHTATARNGAWDVMIPPNATTSVVLKTDGTVDYYCKFHPNMTGQVMVAK